MGGVRISVSALGAQRAVAQQLVDDHLGRRAGRPRAPARRGRRGRGSRVRRTRSPCAASARAGPEPSEKNFLPPVSSLLAARLQPAYWLRQAGEHRLRAAHLEPGRPAARAAPRAPTVPSPPMQISAISKPGGDAAGCRDAGVDDADAAVVARTCTAARRLRAAGARPRDDVHIHAPASTTPAAPCVSLIERSPAAAARRRAAVPADLDRSGVGPARRDAAKRIAGGEVSAGMGQVMRAGPRCQRGGVRLVEPQRAGRIHDLSAADAAGGRGGSRQLAVQTGAQVRAQHQRHRRGYRAMLAGGRGLTSSTHIARHRACSPGCTSPRNPNAAARRARPRRLRARAALRHRHAAPDAAKHERPTSTDRTICSLCPSTTASRPLAMKVADIEMPLTSRCQ